MKFSLITSLALVSSVALAAPVSVRRWMCMLRSNIDVLQDSSLNARHIGDVDGWYTKVDNEKRHIGDVDGWYTKVDENKNINSKSDSRLFNPLK